VLEQAEGRLLAAELESPEEEAELGEVARRLVALEEARVDARLRVRTLEGNLELVVREAQIAAVKMEELRTRMPMGQAPEDIPGGRAREQEMRRLERRLDEIGPTNPLAASELAELDQRCATLERQLEDIVSARRDLEELVGRLREEEDRRYDAVFGGARRDEEKARAKERFFSFRDAFGQWDPKNQRPELWNLYNGRHNPGEHIRVFPLSNWTELDVWRYIAREDIEVPSIYYAHQREVFERDGMLLGVTPVSLPTAGEVVSTRTVRYRTVGDASCTGAVASPARTPDEVVEEIAATRVTERGATRADDRASEAAMEDRKKEGYF